MANLNADRFLFTARKPGEVEQRWVIRKEAERLVPVYEKAGYHVTIKELDADSKMQLVHVTVRKPV